MRELNSAHIGREPHPGNQRLAVLSRRLEDDRIAYQASLEHRNRAIVEEHDNGMSLGQLAQLTGLNKSRIVQIIASWGGEN